MFILLIKNVIQGFTYHDATCDISGLSMGYGYWLAGKGYNVGLDKPEIKENFEINITANNLK